jgi:anti-anti-sigma factor
MPALGTRGYTDPVAEHLTIDVEEAAGARVLVLRGELDLASSPDLSAKGEEVLADGLPLVLDLRNLTFIDSTGLGAIAGVDRTAQKAGTKVSLIPGPATVQRVFEVSGTADAFAWIDPPA